MARYDQCDETCTTDCGHCKGEGKPVQLWDRERVDELKRTALVIAAGTAVVFAQYASPADSLQAGIEMGYPYFSHQRGGYPIYSKHERRD